MKKPRNGLIVDIDSRVRVWAFRVVPYLGTLRWLFIALALGGIAVADWARIDDWKKGLR